MIKIEIVNRENKKTDITQLVEKVTWSGDYKQASRKLEFSIISNKYDKKIPQVDIQEGYMVYFYKDNEELFRGFIYTVEKNTDTTSYLAYDHAQKLVHTKINYNFKNMTAKQITEKMLDDYSKYGIKKGSIVNDGVSWSKVFIGVSMYDTIMSAYTNSHASNGKEYMCYAKEGKIHTALKGDIKLNIQFKEGENIISSTYKSSIENVVNRVIIVDDAGNQIGEEKNSKSIELYGLFQEIVKAESKTTETTTEITESTVINPDTGEETEQPSTGNFIWPVPSVHRISSPFGPRKAPAPGASTFHKGIDIPGGGVSGKSVVASDSGKVVIAKIGYNGGRGNYIVIDHGNKKGSLYQHLQSFSVKVGQSVNQGQEIAKMGSTGVSTGPHLHFEIHECFSGTKGTPVNPQKYVSPNSSSKASKALSVSSASSTSTSTSNSYTLNTTNSVAKAIFDFCIAKGCTPQVACGIVANADTETGGTFSTKLVNSIGASGLLQWLGVRLASLKRKASKKGVSWTNLNLQLEHMWDELSGEESTTVSLLNSRVGGLSKFMRLTDPYKAGYEFGKCFERGGYNEKRGNTAKSWYSKVIAEGNEIKNSNTTTDKTQTDAIETVTTDTTNNTVTDLESAKEEAKKMLTGRERSASLDGYGDPTCITGYGVTVTDSSTGLKGLFYIDTDSHTWENGEYKIQLNLNYKNIMNEVTAGEDEQQQVTTTPINDNYSNDSTEKILNGKKVKALFTAYYPANTKMEGGFYDSLGNRLDPSKNTCAAPKSIPFHTKIQPSGTGSFIDGKTYTVTDRGGKINVVNGVYHIDILMSSASECNKFGKKYGYLIIGDGTGYKAPSTTMPGGNEKPSAKANKLISVAKSKLGCPYVWGASENSTTTFDCSSFTKYIYKTALGINLQRTSNVQGEQGTKITSVSALQPGDLIYFNTYSTERANGITHVGMYIGNGQMIHASYSQKKVVIQNLKPYLAYKGTKFIWARRHI